MGAVGATAGLVPQAAHLTPYPEHRQQEAPIATPTSESQGFVSWRLELRVPETRLD